MCDVGETRILANGVSPASLLAAAKLRRPSCDEQQDKAAPGTPSPSRSTPSTPTSLRRASSLEKCFSDPEFFKKQRQLQRSRLNGCPSSPARGDGKHPRRSPSSSRGGNNSEEQPCSEPTAAAPENGNQCNGRLADAEEDDHEVITNGASKSSREDCDVCDGPTNGKDIMAPVLGVPPPPPPAPHMGPDGLILPRKPYNPCIGSNSHKDLHRELLFNQKIGKNVLNQKSELQRALEKHREMVSRKEAERVQEESYKSDPRTALQRAIEQRAKHIQLVQQPQQTEPPNPLVTARAKLRSRIDSQ